MTPELTGAILGHSPIECQCRHCRARIAIRTMITYWRIGGDDPGIMLAAMRDEVAMAGLKVSVGGASKQAGIYGPIMARSENLDVMI